MSCGSLIVI
jgi:hypothetical protein